MKHATALRAFSHAGDDFAAGSTHSIAAGHFADWEAVGLVRAATDAEIAKAKGDKGTPRTPARRGRKPKAVVPVDTAPAEPAVAPDGDPAAPAA